MLRNAVRVVGVDISKDRIRRLRNILLSVESIVANVTDLSSFPDNSFDMVISNQVIEHVPEDTKMLTEIWGFNIEDF